MNEKFKEVDNEELKDYTQVITNRVEIQKILPSQQWEKPLKASLSNHKW